LVGTNYMPSKAFFRFWEDWNRVEIENDLRTMESMGIRAVRVPLFWSSVQPRVAVSRKFLQRFDEFLEIAQEHNIYVMPFLFVGVCVDTWDVPWRRGRNIYTDPEMRKIECKQAETLAARYANHPAILAWDISDEPYYYAGNTDAKTATNWVSIIYNALKSRDKTHPVTLGFDNNHIVEDTGFQVEKLVSFQDFFSLCAYPIYGLKTPEAHTSMRSTYFTSFFIKFSDVGKPVLLSEGPGTTTTWTSPKRAGDYYKVVMYSSFVNGSIGIMPWIFIDYDSEHHGKFPLDDKPYETSFGILNSQGEMKPPAEELRKFNQTITKIDLGKFHFRKPECALLIPRDYYKHVKTIWPRLFEAFILAKEAHIELGFVREGADLTGYKLVIVPSSCVLRTSAWYALRTYVEQGGNLYFSYGGSPIGSPNPLGPFFDEIFGVSLQDRIAPMSSEQISFTANVASSNPVKLAYPKTDGASCLEIELKTGTEHALDARENIALVVNKALGKGTATLATHPIEYYLSMMPDAYIGNETFRVYEMLAEQAELIRPFRCANPFLEIGWMETETQTDAILIMINHERMGINPTVSLLHDWHIRNVSAGDSGFSNACKELELSFEPSDIKILNLRR